MRLENWKPITFNYSGTDFIKKFDIDFIKTISTDTRQKGISAYLDQYGCLLVSNATYEKMINCGDLLLNQIEELEIEVEVFPPTGLKRGFSKEDKS